MTTMYGIKNCDTIKKARKWLEQQNIEYTFHDYRADGIDKSWLQDVCNNVDWQALLNTRGTTYRQLSDQQKSDMNQSKAIELMLEYPAMIKRPLLLSKGTYQLGFKPEQYQDLFA
ncbi:ArsC family reductase [Neptunicella marina]|uniref:ArsC family reductase n=1 Tax=Neptunicella marina TaxID=2125989 RepID=A0A8J6LZU9_9ALTE|nr:ArsC family reductase [Neptunicella marina]MBC3764332.1 ArsC family reductase [Neptunicella marina]